jgi:hypothetical protein
MRKKSLETTICKLAIAGEHDGFTVEEMICFPQRGLSVEELLEVIALRLEKLPASRLPVLVRLDCRAEAPAEYTLNLCGKGSPDSIEIVIWCLLVASPLSRLVLTQSGLLPVR